MNRTRLRTLLPSMALVLLLAGTIGFGWQRTHRPEPRPRFCTADGFIVADADPTTPGDQPMAYSRDNERGCAWVDEEGELVPIDPATGSPYVVDP